MCGLPKVFCTFCTPIFHHSTLMINSKCFSHLSRVMRKQDYCLCENKGADQLCSYCTADQCLCFHYKDSMIPSLLIPKISTFWFSSVTVHGVFMSDLVRNCSEALKDFKVYKIQKVRCFCLSDSHNLFRLYLYASVMIRLCFKLLQDLCHEKTWYQSYTVQLDT